LVEQVMKPDQGEGVEIVKITHFPKDGGVKELQIVKRGDGTYFLRLGTYSKKQRDQQIMRLDESEISLLALKLLKVLINGSE